MVHAWDTVLIAVKVVDNVSNQVHFLEPYAFSETDRWTKQGDMAVQYANCIKNNLIENSSKYKDTINLSNNFSIYFDVWCSLNGRFQQRFFHPQIDMLKVNWSPFNEVSFILPLLREFSYLRPKLNKLTKDVLSWSNHSDVMFIADFPNFSMDNYISPDLDNVTLTILKGTVIYEEEETNKTKTLTVGENCNVTPNQFHKIRTISKTPSCFMYSFVNKTLQNLNQNDPNFDNILEQKSKNDNKSILSIFEEFQTRWENYKKFISHIANSILFEFYGVPMPRRIKEIL